MQVDGNVGQFEGELQSGTENAKVAQQHQEFQIMPAVLLVILILLLIGVLPTWSHSANWGYVPSGGLGLVVIVVVVLMLVGRI